ncbi:MAG TPA: FHA domain-containing protein [Streptosporangiaceae bacterium]
MSEQGGAARRAGRISLPSRSRRRWKIVAAVVVCWVVLLLITGSALGATIFLVVIAALAVAAVFGLRALGVTRDHPWVQRMSSRPWRDGQDVLQQALRHVSEVFVVTPSGTLLAPDVVDLRMNPQDLAVLGERMEPSVVMESATEVYLEQVQAQGARLARRVPTEVRIIADPSIPEGRYRLKPGQPVNPYAASDAPGQAPVQAPGQAPAQDPVQAQAPQPAAQAPAQAPPAAQAPAPYQRPQLVPDFGTNDGYTQAQASPAGGATVSGLPTVLERNQRAAPPLRLITGGAVAETTVSGARAGRGHAVELGLPEVPTVSREHAKFTYSDGQWYVTNLGMNGITLNGRAVTGEHAVSTGDSIRWGTRPDALLSEVQIG